MDLDTLLHDADLPPAPANTEPALARTVERGRRRRRGRRLAGGAAAIAVVGCVVGLALTVDRDDGQRVVAGPPLTATTTVPTEPEAGDPASWTVRPGQVLDPTDTTFTAEVVRERCNGGVTGTVLRPGVVMTDAEVVVTFTVEANPGVHTCPGNPSVPYEVDVGHPIGDRQLVDGSCRTTRSTRNGSCIRYAFHSTAGAGDTAVWDVDPAAPPGPEDTTFTALVQRLGCNGGVTGRVLSPVVELTDTEVVVTFLVEADLDGGTCPGNDAVPYAVDVGEPIGDRTLVDAACRTSDAATTSLCQDRGVRWP